VANPTKEMGDIMKPTLEEQIAISKLTDEECLKLLLPHTLLGKIDYWIHNHALLLWRLYRWNWFNTWTGEWGFRLFVKHKFKEWEENSESRNEN